MIQAENLSMAYGSVKALSGASFHVGRGEVLGLLGPNGAGKTTTLRILTTVLRPSSGRVLIDGIDAGQDPLAARRRIGYLPESAPLYVDMEVAAYLAFVGRARGLAGTALRSAVSRVVADCALESVYYRPISQLSKGFRQRVGLAQALIHDPDILILDEPTSGLDPLQILGIRELIKRLARAKTILFSTHILQEVQAVSDRVMILSEGRIVATGTADELERRAMGADRLAIEVALGGNADAADVRAALAAIPGVIAVESRPASPGCAAFWLAHAFDDAEVVTRVAQAIARGGWIVQRFTHERLSLDDVFVELIREGAVERKSA